MRVIKKIVIYLILVLIGIQWIPSTQNKNSLIPEKDLFTISNAPESLITLFKTSCYDCHSNNTNYPWYSGFQPMRFIMDKHVKNGKNELNFNDFTNYSIRRQKSKLKSIVSQLMDNQMPLKSYSFFHRDARLSEKEGKLMIDWINKIKDSL